MRIYFKLLIALITFVSLFVFISTAETANVPESLNYQGTLTDNTGQQVSGTKNITFSLYTVPVQGTAFWTETQSVSIVNGLFSVVLGNTSKPMVTSNFTGETYIGISVDGGLEMSPRQKMTSVAYALKAADAIPKGLISMWSGSIASIPEGWALCDGSKGTPDLRDRFIVGAGSGYGVGTTGGEATHVLTIAEIPGHTHPQNPHTHPQDPHNHGITDPGHTHSYTTENNDGKDKMRAGTSGGGTYGPYSNSILANTTGISINGITATNQNTTATNQNTGGGAAHENRPPYYALAFIMKL